MAGSVTVTIDTSSEEEFDKNKVRSGAIGSHHRSDLIK